VGIRSNGIRSNGISWAYTGYPVGLFCLDRCNWSVETNLCETWRSCSFW